jgi:cell division protein FtsI (penicillin-binding protein 3)
MLTFLRTYGRSRALVLILLVFIGIFSIRLFTIQILDHQKYKALALSEQQAKFVLKAQRGEIYARDGSEVAPLVLNEPVYTIYADPSQVTEAAKVESTVRSVAGDKAVKDMDALTDKKRQYIVLAKEVTRDQAQSIKDKHYAGVGETQTTERVYPEGALGSQLLGFVNADGEGQYGIEQSLDARLKGTDGLLQTVTDVRNIPLTVSDNDISIPAKDGEDVVLSVDGAEERS